MKSVSISEARASLDRLLDEAADSGEPILLVGEGSSGVLVSEDYWRGVQETLRLLSVPGMGESIRGGLGTPLDGCVPEPGW